MTSFFTFIATFKIYLISKSTAMRGSVQNIKLVIGLPICMNNF